MNFKRKIMTFLLSIALILSLTANTHIKASAKDSFSHVYPQAEITVSCTLDNETVITK